MRLTLDVHGDVQLARELRRIAGFAGDATPVMEALADDFLRIERRQFDSAGGYGSGGWAALAPATVRRKARLGLDPRILHATLAMRHSLTKRGAPGQVRRVTRSSVEVGTSVTDPDTGFPYPAAHQHGTARMPRRRPVELPERDRKRWVKAVQRYVITGEVNV